MKKQRIIAGAMSLALIASTLGCGATKKDDTSQKQLEDIENTTTVWGEVKYNDSYIINIDFPSTVENVIVKEGQEVKNGDVLVKLNMSEYEKNIEKLKAQLSANESTASDATQGTEGLEKDIANLKSDISKKSEEYNNGTKAELQSLENSLTRINKEVEDAQKDVDQQEYLFQMGAISEDTLDQYKDVLNQKITAKTEIETNIDKTKRILKEELDSLNVSLKYKEEQLSKLQSSNDANSSKANNNVTISQTDLDIIKEKASKGYISDSNIICNIENGIVQNISVINGTQLGTQNMPTKVLEIIDEDSIIVSAEVPEEFIDNVELNQTVDIVPASNKNIKISGTVTRIPDMAVEKDGERIVKVEITPNDTDKILKPGYSLDVIF